MEQHEKDAEQQTLLQMIPSGLGIYDITGNEIHMICANDRYCRMLGTPPEQLPVAGEGDGGHEKNEEHHRQIMARVMPQDLEKIGRVMGTMLRGQEGVDTVFRYRLPGEEKPRWYQMRAYSAAREKKLRCYIGLNDITNEKEFEEEARKNQRMYSLIAESTRLIIWEYDPRSRRMVYQTDSSYTRTFCRERGIPPVIENAPESLLGRVDAPYRDAFRSLFREPPAGMNSMTCEYSTTRDGKKKWWSVVCSVDRDDTGAARHIYCAARDTTERHQERENYQRLYAQLTGNLTDVVGSFQINLTRNLYISGFSVYPRMGKKQVEKTADAYFAAVAGTVADEALRQEIRGFYRCQNLLELYQRGEKEFHREFPVRAPSGTVLWIDSTLHLLQNPDSGEIEGIYCAKDVTKQKKDEAIMTRISQSGYDFIGIIDPFRRTFELHNGFWECSGMECGVRVDYDFCVERLTGGCVVPGEREALAQALALDTVAEAVREKGKTVLTYSFQEAGKPLSRKQISLDWLDGDRQEILAVQADITAAYEQEQQRLRQLETALLLAEKANEMKTNFLGNVSHDMRTPLNAVLGYNRLALESDDMETVKDYLRKIASVGDALTSLIDDTLDLQKIESGAIRLHPEPVSSRKLVEEIATTMNPIMAEKNLRFRLDVKNAELVTLRVDVLRLRQIILNLLSNAVKFTPEGGCVEMCIECLGRENNLAHDRFIIRDSGIGMSQAFLERMYEPFSQERTPDTAHIDGSGLGLSIVKRIVDLMGGHITVKSELGRGTEFAVYLDLERVDDTETADDSRTEAPVSIQGRRILLCEDNLMNAEIARHILTANGAEVVTASNGQEGYARFCASTPEEFDFILMDIRMPVMDGYTAAKAIRCSPHPRAGSIPILAMTADAYAGDVEAALRAGMNGHLAKPVDPQKLLHAISALMAREDRSGEER